MIYRRHIGLNPDQEIIAQIRDDGVISLFDPINDNTIGEHYRAWLAEGNEPLPALQPETQSEPDSLET